MNDETQKRLVRLQKVAATTTWEERRDEAMDRSLPSTAEISKKQMELIRAYSEEDPLKAIWHEVLGELQPRELQRTDVRAEPEYKELSRQWGQALKRELYRRSYLRSAFDSWGLVTPAATRGKDVLSSLFASKGGRRRAGMATAGLLALYAVARSQRSKSSGESNKG